ncbi:hypothetical protein [Amycolatopsis jiangsuensis]|uniref:Uncharacterized protein n=1 Tax=Amycolatopsis jiangsuensis TaxID=1181879 RepID=A0A840J2M8_9PSEU|nr:hypothetical protein [Amycolatopsis jiangsuensis]MBB4688310.1 hypothetical protein [Amycolatopsis jiangsuensis]
MTTLTVIGTIVGLGVLVLMSLAPVLVDLNERFPATPEKQATHDRPLRNQGTREEAGRKPAAAAKALLAHGVPARPQTFSARV